MTVKLSVQWLTVPAFGGRDFDTIYVTIVNSDDPAEDGGVFAQCVPVVKGLPEAKFAG